MDINNIKSIMKFKKITQNDLSEITGVPLQTIKCILTGRTKFPRIDTVEAIERALGLDKPSEAWEIGKARVPLVGQVVAGVPVEASEYFEGWVTVDFPTPEDYFALRVTGDSMINARIFPNDILIVKKQNYAENGDIIVASIDGESTVKRYKEFGENKFLMPENQNYSPILISEKSRFHIFGKVVEIRAKV